MMLDCSSHQLQPAWLMVKNDDPQYLEDTALAIPSRHWLAVVFLAHLWMPEIESGIFSMQIRCSITEPWTVSQEDMEGLEFLTCVHRHVDSPVKPELNFFPVH
ncbi:Hypothetical predicted protein [Podarcis lilfordi]|uniref:Uncharacterized protein n=1 Tax=Podarcis lilfordi TaxID=74358 RepID=A0AA35KUL4_9SAUR|nr:Hypothetical predicted protein [Podarcis lilfordi]